MSSDGNLQVLDSKVVPSTPRSSIRSKVSEAAYRYVTPVLQRLIQWHLNETVAAAFHDFERARRLRATFDSMDYAEAHMQAAAVRSSKLGVLNHALSHPRREGLYLEFGVWSGMTVNFIADHCKGPVHGFDSFEGLPEDWWDKRFRQGAFSTNGKLPSVRPNVQLHVGWFENTLPKFVAEHEGPVSFLHVDSDLYSSAKTIFKFLGDRIGSGTIIVFDEYFNYPTWREHEYKAFQEFIAERGLRYRYLAYNQKQCSAAVVIE
jgi:hypothetical protein